MRSPITDRQLLLLPGTEDVFLAVFAGVADQGEGQVVTFAAVLVNALTFAALGNVAFVARDREGVVFDSVGAANVDLALAVAVDVKCVVGVDPPDGSVRVGPGAGKRFRAHTGHVRAPVKRGEKKTHEHVTQRCFHGADVVRCAGLTSSQNQKPKDLTLNSGFRARMDNSNYAGPRSKQRSTRVRPRRAMGVARQSVWSGEFPCAEIVILFGLVLSR